MPSKLNKYSSRITDSLTHGFAQAQLYATGIKPGDIHKPQVGIASVWFDGNPCNMHLRDFGDLVKKSVIDSEMLGMRFSTVGVSDVISMGTEGMHYSLQSRDLIADSIETMMSAHWYDACVAIPGCDKNMPGCMMALARLNRPGFIIYGGAIQPGCLNHKSITLHDVYANYEAYRTGKLPKKEYENIIEHACPGKGSCAAMYTANTMASSIEAMGLCLPYSASNPANSEEKLAECRAAGKIIRNLLEKDIKPRDIMTREAFENAMVLTIALGGSTNVVLHLLAVAYAADIQLSLDDFATIAEKTPLIADMLPFGKYNMVDLYRVGGIPAVMKLLLEGKLIHGDCLTITGLSIAENLHSLPALKANQKVIHSLKTPIKKTGHLRILRGNLAPEGAVAKITGHEGEMFSGPAKVFEDQSSMIESFENGHIQAGDVIVIRYQGPKGGPGMPEMLLLTSRIAFSHLSGKVALITDGRFSGGSKGFIIGHVSPEAQVGGPIALLQDGDMIRIDAIKNTITVEVSPEILEHRQRLWTMPPYKVKKGALLRYIQTVRSASKGCITDELP